MRGLGCPDLKDIYSADSALGKNHGNTEIDSSSQTEQDGCTEEKDSAREPEDTREHFGRDTDDAAPNISRKAELFMYQLISNESDFSVLEQRLTFLGRTMACLRSSLACWLQSNQNCSQSVWTPSLKEAGRSPTEQFSFRSSASFSCILFGLYRGDWKWRMDKRYVQMRLLWELQSYFLNRLPSEGISPDRHEAIILCLLSFPVIECHVIQEEAEDSELSVIDTGESLSLSLESGIKDIKLPLSIPLAPQPIHISVLLRPVGQSTVDVIVFLCGKCEFEWERWRNDFTSRLEGVRKWQQQNGLDNTPVIETEERITSILQSVQVTAFGTGKYLQVWKGWLPHRASMSLFELTSDNFITQIMKGPIDPKRKLVVPNGLFKSKNVAVHYDAAATTDFEHASAVAHHMLGLLARNDFGEQADLLFDGESMLVDLSILTACGRAVIDSN